MASTDSITTIPWYFTTMDPSLPPQQVCNPTLYYPVVYKPPEPPPNSLYQTLPQNFHPYNFESHSSQATYAPQMFDRSPERVSVTTTLTSSPMFQPTPQPFHNPYGLDQYTPPEIPPPYTYHPPQPPEDTPPTPPLSHYVQPSPCLYTPLINLTCHTTLSTKQPFYAVETLTSMTSTIATSDVGTVVADSQLLVTPQVFDESPHSPELIVNSSNDNYHQRYDKFTEIIQKLEEIGKNLADRSRISKDMSSKKVSQSSHTLTHVPIVSNLDKSVIIEKTGNVDSKQQLDILAPHMFDESPENELRVDQEDKSVYEDVGDTCEIDNETETKAEVSCVDEAKTEVETNAKKLLPPLLHLAFQAFDKFISKLGRFPVASTDKNAQKLITIVDILNESGGDAVNVVDINPEFLRQFPFGTRVVLKPLAAIVGGIVGQEVKTRPMVATKLQKKLEDAQVFIVGSGASRDPSKKQAPMCVVHTSPHNIDHWLIWARSEYEGLLEKTPTEVDTILSDTSEYTSAIVSAGIFEWKDKDAMFSFVEATYKQQDRVRTLFDTGWNTLHQKHIHNDKFEGVITTYRQVGEWFNPSAALKSVFSAAAKIERLGNWFTDGSDPRRCCTYLLDATDSLFIEIGKAFIRQIFDPGGQAMEFTRRWRDVFWSVMFVTMLVLLKAAKLIKNEKWYHILEDKNVLKSGTM